LLVVAQAVPVLEDLVVVVVVAVYWPLVLQWSKI
jgi:hypothetical protein